MGKLRELDLFCPGRTEEDLIAAFCYLNSLLKITTFWDFDFIEDNWFKT